MWPTTTIDDDAIVWSHPEGARAGRSLVVCLHGYHGHETDWSTWFATLPADTVGASLRAPLRVREKWGWVDLERWGTTSSRAVSDLSAAARGVSAWIERQQADRVALVGWSQGGALAVHLVRHHPARFAGAAVVAGFVADLRPHQGVRARRPRVWYGMGRHDDVIPRDVAARSRRWLAEHTTATLVDLPDDDHMLSPTLVGPALEFVADALAALR